MLHIQDGQHHYLVKKQRISNNNHTYIQADSQPGGRMDGHIAYRNILY